jgi:DNA invertase Pin-like site-specific DNA recombinase
MSPWQVSWGRIDAIENTVNDVPAKSGLLQSLHSAQAEPDRRYTDGTPHRARTSATGARTKVSPSEISSSSSDSVRSFAPLQDRPRPQPASSLHTAVLGYISVDAARPEDSNGEVRRQARQIAVECERRGLVLLQLIHDCVPSRQRSLDRPGLADALDRISAGQAGGLIVSELSNLSRGVPDLGRVLEWLRHHDARVITLAPNIDTQEEAGRLAIRTIVEVSRWERQRLAERTRAGMRAARRKGPASVADDPELRDRIAGMRAAGMTLQAIADQLNAERIPTRRGGAMWRPSSVQSAAGYQRPPTSRASEPHPGGGRGLEVGETDGHPYRARADPEA